MIINLNKEQNIEIDYKDCPRCHRPFNAKKRKKTWHHAIPKFLKSLTEVKVRICLECHDELNKCYVTQKISMKKFECNSKTFVEFEENLERLTEDFHAKKLNRGQFGTGLWSNLVSYLGAVDANLK